jgi:predicted Zn-dependent peptidase
VAVGWKMPLRDSPDYYPLAVLSEVLLGGTAGLLHQKMVKQEADELISAPAVAVGWKMPLADSPDYYPLAVLSEVLLGGTAGLLYQKLVKQEQTMLAISGGMGWPLGNPLTIAGPSLLTFYGTYKPGSDGQQNVDQVQAVIDSLARRPIDPARLLAVQTKMIADFYKLLAGNLNRAQYLGIAQLIHGDAQVINRYPDRVRQVTVADLQRVAGKYLTVANRSWIDRIVAPVAQPALQQAAQTEPPQ